MNIPGGVPEPRPDQRLQPRSRAGSGPAPQQNIVIGRFVIVAGATGGLFVYSPTAATGNLVASIAASNGTDPYGNSYFAGFATYTASSGHSFVVDLLSTATATLGFFQYNNPSGGVQGQLILSVAAAAGTDPVTAAAYPAGLKGIDPVFGDFTLVQGSGIGFHASLNRPFTRDAGSNVTGSSGVTVAPSIKFDAPEDTSAHHFQFVLTGTSPDGTTITIPQMLMGSTSGGTQLTRITSSMLELQAGSFAITNTTAPATVATAAQLFSSTGQLDYVAGVTGDGQTYNTGRLSQITTATTTINATTAVAITGLSFNVAAAKYRVSGMIRLTAAASGTVQPFAVQVTGTATVSTMLLDFVQWNAEGTPTATLGVTTALASDPTHIIGTLGNSNVATFYVDGSVTFSAAGTFVFGARQVTLSTDETATAQTGNFIDLMPVS